MAEICPDPSCFNDWESIENALCQEQFEAGMSALILFRCGVERDDIIVDASDPAVLDPAKIAALIAADDAKVMSGMEIVLDAPSELTGKTFDPCNPEAAVNYDRTITIGDPNVTEIRRKFWASINAVNGFINGGAIVYECSTERWTYIDKKIFFSGGRASGATNAELQVFNYVGKWRNKDDAEIFPPAAIVLT